MPVSPQHCRQSQKEKFEKDLGPIVEKIDGYLMNNIGFNEILYSPVGLSDREIGYICDLYRAVGWIVRADLARDVPAIVFKEG